jgi:hypothetical protein
MANVGAVGIVIIGTYLLRNRLARDWFVKVVRYLYNIRLLFYHFTDNFLLRKTYLLRLARKWDEESSEENSDDE